LLLSAEFVELQQVRAGTPGEDWISGADAVDLFGLALNRLYQWRDEGCPILGGTKLGAHRIRVGKGTQADHNGARVRLVWHFNRRQVEEIAAALRAGFLDAGVQDTEGSWLSAAVAEERYGIVSQQPERWRDKPCCFLGGSTIRHRPVACAAQGLRHGGVLLVYHEGDLRRIADARRRDAPAVCTDAAGVWLFAS
jgi:hypothetical protein